MSGPEFVAAVQAARLMTIHSIMILVTVAVAGPVGGAPLTPAGDFLIAAPPLPGDLGPSLPRGEALEAFDSLVLDFDASGLYLFRHPSSLSSIHAGNANSLASGTIDATEGGEVVAALGGSGLWAFYNRANWSQLHPFAARSAVTADIDGNGRADVIVDFGSSHGIWVLKNATSWSQLHTVAPTRMAVANLDGPANGNRSDLVIDFGPQWGIWIYMNDASWRQLHTVTSTGMVVGDLDGQGTPDLIIDFGSQWGIWMYRNNSAWFQLHTVTARAMTTGRLDAGNLAEVIVDFGSQWGIWVYRNNAAWSRIHSLSAEGLLAADLDGNGRDDVVADLGSGTGTWVYYNDSSWTKIHNSSPGVMTKVRYAVVAGCSFGTDSDGDRLDNCVETNTGVFVSSNDTGTDPLVADTDGDGIRDGDEVLGTTGSPSLNLPAMGASPLRKNVFLEYDWFNDNLDPGVCGAHSHRPTAGMASVVSATFADAPVSNPDRSTGITVIHDYGQGGVFTGGNLISDANGVIVGGVNNSEFLSHKNANFASNRHGYFHYVLLPHRYDTNSASSGQAELPGDDLIVSLYCYGSDYNQAATTVHEIGHNFNLRHGGFEDCNYKPNYNSVMNYKYSFPGVDANCSPVGDSVIDYSRGTRIDLNEANLNEFAGICGSVSWDWNGSNTIQSSVAYELNREGDFANSPVTGLCAAGLSVLRDQNDWAVLYFGGISDADAAPREVIDCTHRPPAPR